METIKKIYNYKEKNILNLENNIEAHFACNSR